MRKTFRVSGLVIDRKNRTGVANLRVEAWDGDLIFDEFVGKADTDAEGRFQIEFKESYFSEIFLDRRPDLFFKIFLDNDLVASTEGSVLWNVCLEVTDLTFAVDTPKRSEQAPEKPFVVKGTIDVTALTETASSVVGRT